MEEQKAKSGGKIIFSYGMKENSLMKVESLTKSINAASRLFKAVAKGRGLKVDVFISDFFITGEGNSATYHVELLPLTKGAVIKNMKYTLPDKIVEIAKAQIASDSPAPKIEPLQQDEALPHAILVDLDGTLCKMNGRSPYEWDKVDQDEPNKAVVALVENYYRLGTRIILFSGRDGSCAAKTINWIHQHTQMKYGANADSMCRLFMRSPGDTRKDAIVKREMFDEHIRGRYYIEFVLDDRNQVVDLWRQEIGLPCFQVNYGNF